MLRQMEEIGTRSKKKFTRMMKKHLKKKLELGKHTLFGRWGGHPDPRNFFGESIFYYVPPLPWFYYAVASFSFSDVVC